MEDPSDRPDFPSSSIEKWHISCRAWRGLKQGKISAWLEQEKLQFLQLDKRHQAAWAFIEFSSSDQQKEFAEKLKTLYFKGEVIQIHPAYPPRRSPCSDIMSPNISSSSSSQDHTSSLPSSTTSMLSSSLSHHPASQSLQSSLLTSASSAVAGACQTSSSSPHRHLLLSPLPSSSSSHSSASDSSVFASTTAKTATVSSSPLSPFLFHCLSPLLSKSHVSSSSSSSVSSPSLHSSSSCSSVASSLLPPSDPEVFLPRQLAEDVDTSSRSGLANHHVSHGVCTLKQEEEDEEHEEEEGQSEEKSAGTRKSTKRRRQISLESQSGLKDPEGEADDKKTKGETSRAKKHASSSSSSLMVNLSSSSPHPLESTHVNSIPEKEEEEKSFSHGQNPSSSSSVPPPLHEDPQHKARETPCLLQGQPTAPLSPSLPSSSSVSSYLGCRNLPSPSFSSSSSSSSTSTPLPPARATPTAVVAGKAGGGGGKGSEGVGVVGVGVGQKRGGRGARPLPSLFELLKGGGSKAGKARARGKGKSGDETEENAGNEEDEEDHPDSHGMKVENNGRDAVEGVVKRTTPLICFSYPDQLEMKRRYMKTCIRQLTKGVYNAAIQEGLSLPSPSRGFSSSSSGHSSLPGNPNFWSSPGGVSSRVGVVPPLVSPLDEDVSVSTTDRPEVSGDAGAQKMKKKEGATVLIGGDIKEGEKEKEEEEEEAMDQRENKKDKEEDEEADESKKEENPCGKENEDQETPPPPPSLPWFHPHVARRWDGCEVLPTLPSPPNGRCNYRNKCEFTVGYTHEVDEDYDEKLHQEIRYEWERRRMQRLLLPHCLAADTDEKPFYTVLEHSPRHYLVSLGAGLPPRSHSHLPSSSRPPPVEKSQVKAREEGEEEREKEEDVEVHARQEEGGEEEETERKRKKEKTSTGDTSREGEEEDDDDNKKEGRVSSSGDQRRKRHLSKEERERYLANPARVCVGFVKQIRKQQPIVSPACGNLLVSHAMQELCLELQAVIHRSPFSVFNRKTTNGLWRLMMVRSSESTHELLVALLVRSFSASRPSQPLCCGTTCLRKQIHTRMQKEEEERRDSSLSSSTATSATSCASDRRESCQDANDEETICSTLREEEEGGEKKKKNITQKRSLDKGKKKEDISTDQEERKEEEERKKGKKDEEDDRDRSADCCREACIRLLIEAFAGKNFDGYTVKSIFLQESDAASDCFDFARPIQKIWGGEEDYILQRLLGLDFQVGPLSFFQTNSVTCPLLFMTALEFLLPNLHEEESLGERYGLLDLCCGTGTFALCAAALLRKKVTKFRKFFSRQASLLLPYHPHRPASLRSFSSSSSFDMDAGALRKRKKRERERKRDEEEDEERENREDDSEDSSSDEEEEEGEEGGPLERSKEEEKKEEERSKERKKKRGEGGDESKEKEEKEKENKEEEGGRRPRIVGIEVVEEAIHHARLNAERNGLSQDVRFICGKAEAVLPDLLASAEFNTSFQKLAAIVDPPRSGLHSRTLDALINFKPLKRLVYVSCNAASMVSNCIRLCTPSVWNRDAFVPLRLASLDMFPHTYHCEAILYLCRQSEVEKCRKELQVNRKKFSFISFPPKIEEWTYLQQDTPHPLHPSLHSQPSAASHPLSDLHFHPHSLGDSVDGKVQSSPTAKAPPARTSTTTRRRKRKRTRTRRT